MSDPDPAKRIPKSLNTDANALGSYTLTDLAVGLLPAVLVVLATRVLLPQGATVFGITADTLTLPLAAVGIILGATVVYLTPEYADTTDWLTTAADYLLADKRLSHETARRKPAVRRVHPDHDAIERRDGAVVGAVEIDPPTMGLATTAEWSRKADGFEDVLNTIVEFPLQLYSTTEPFPVDDHLRGYEQRLTDPDVESNPQLARLIEGYVDWYRTELQQRPTTIRRHYAIVTVTPEAVRFDDESVRQQLVAVPYLGHVVKAITGGRAVERRAEMFETLDARLRRVEAGFREIEGCSAERLATDDLAGLVREFWTGQQHSSDTNVSRRMAPIIGGGEPR